MFKQKMKYRVLVLVFFASHSILLTAQVKNLLCKSTLPLSAETVSTIFTSILDKSIFILDSDSYYEADPSICLEGTIESVVDESPGMRLLEYTFLQTKSKNNAIEKYNELLKEFKKCQPKYWYAIEKDFGQKEKIRWAGQDEELDYGPGVKYYMFTDKENNYTKQVSLSVTKSVTEWYSVAIYFSYHFPEGEKYMDILEGLKDGSLRGAVFGPNRWKSKILLEGQIDTDICNIMSDDYGKSKGTASVVYWFLDGEKGNTDASLNLFEKLKQQLKDFKPERWYSDDFEMPDKSIRKYHISKSAEGYAINLYWNDGNDVYIEFVSNWD